MRDKFIRKGNGFFEDENFNEKQNEKTNDHLEKVCPLPKVEGWIVSTLSDSIKGLSMEELKSFLARLQKINFTSFNSKNENIDNKCESNE